MSRTTQFISVPNGNIISYNADGYDDEINHLWDNKNCHWKYNEKTDKEDVSRNNTIDYIRQYYSAPSKKNRKSRYGSNPYFYVSEYHKEMFIEIVTALGLARDTEKLRTEKIDAIQYTAEIDIKQRGYSFKDLDKCQKAEENEY